MIMKIKPERDITLEEFKKWLNTPYWAHVFDGVSNEELVRGHVGSYG